MTQETLNVTGNVTIQKFNSFGELVDQREIKNLVVTTGKNFIAGRLVSNTQAVTAPAMALGTSNTAAVIGQTALIAQVGSKNTTALAAVGNVVTYTSTFGAGVPSGSAQAITEAGLFADNSTGPMIARTVFSVLNKDPGDTISISWALTIA